MYGSEIPATRNDEEFTFNYYEEIKNNSSSISATRENEEFTFNYYEVLRD